MKVSISSILKHQAKVHFSEPIPAIVSLIILGMIVVVPHLYRHQFVEMVNNIKAEYGMGDSVISFYIPSICAVFMQLFMNAYYAAIYYVELPFFEQYKCSGEPWPWKKNVKKFKKKVKETLIHLAINETLAITFIGLFLYAIGYTTSHSDDSHPSLLSHVLQILAMMVCEDFMFYWFHRALHTPYLYKKIHSIHHEYRYNITLCSEYSHIVELIFGNVGPTYLFSILSMGRANTLS